MRNRIWMIILAIVVVCPGAFAQSVVVTGKKVVYKRLKPISPEKRTFWINHPRVRASTPALSRKIQTAISFEKVIPLNVKEEINDIQWLEEADFTVDYNNNGLLTVTLSIYGSGAYPSSSNTTVVVDTKTGSRIEAKDIFIDLGGLAATIKKIQEKEIAEAIAEIRNDPNAGESDPESLFENANFTAADIKEFSVGNKGVTFMYEYGFPHVIQALQPSGTYFLPWGELKPFIKPDGLLTRIAH